MAIDPLLWMLIGHALADYPLQGDWLSKAKNPALGLIPGEAIWPGALACHAAIHAGAVRLATGSWILAGCEFVAHGLIDYAKCTGRLSYNQDQLLHVACKLIWFFMLLGGL
ncbi:MAG: DUF3307 domain-containing protein [Methylobacterium sp.]|nr:DUF3307 domain-containing protein [Methylobacterium sp.]